MSASAPDAASVTFSLEGPEPFLDDAEHQLVGKQNPVVYQAIRVSHGTLRSYGGRNDYHVDPIIDSVQLPTSRRDDGVLTIEWGWDHEAAVYFNHGVRPHRIDGDPILSFIWRDAPQEVREMFANTERVGGDPRVFFRSVQHPGIPEARFVEAGLEWLRQEVG